MKQECIEAVGRALNREPSKALLDRIDADLVQHLREFARADPKRFASLSRAERMQEARTRAVAARLAEADLVERRAGLQVLAADRLTKQYAERRAAQQTGARAVYEIVDRVAIYAKGVARENFARMMDALEAAEPRFLGLLENKAAVRDFAREVLAPGSTGNQIAARGARAWLDTVEAMRVRFNAAGGNVGKLDYGYLPQPHDNVRVRLAGKDKWAADTLPLIDRSRYVTDDGVPMNDQQLIELLRSAYDTIASDGRNKIEPGQSRGTGARAKHGSEHRILHFADADAYMAYMDAYGHGSVFTAMQSHITSLSRDIGLVEQMGPNPEAAFRLIDDYAVRDDNGVKLVGSFAVSTRQLWATAAGKTTGVEHVRLAEIAQGVRNAQVFGKLQGAFLSAIADIGTLFVTARFNRLPAIDVALNVVRAMGKETTEYANRAGLIADTVIADMNRFAESNLRDGWTGKLANTTMKASLLAGWTDVVRRGFSVTMMAGLGKIAKRPWAQLEAADRLRLERKGVTEADWAIWNRAALEDWRGQPMLTPDAVRGVADPRATQAATRLLAVLVDESEYASVMPDLYARAAIERGTQRGTIEGELLRSIALFKGFPMGIISRHWGRAADTWRNGDRASAVGYASGLVVAGALFGALAVQLKELVAGKDPRDMTEAKFWGAAVVQGGGVGIVGDMLYTGAGGMSRNGLPNWFNLAGPVFSTAAEAANLTIGNAFEAARGEQTNVGAEAVRFARANMPFVNLWYAKAALDQAIFHDMQELMSPGYLDRMQARTRRDFGTGYWWKPREPVPQRAPDWAGAIGQ